MHADRGRDEQSTTYDLPGVDNLVMKHTPDVGDGMGSELRLKAGYRDEISDIYRSGCDKYSLPGSRFNFARGGGTGASGAPTISLIPESPAYSMENSSAAILRAVVRNLHNPLTGLCSEQPKSSRSIMV